VERPPVRGRYRGFEIAGAPPPTAGGLHVIEMLNILEGYDLGAMGFGTPESIHLLAEVMRIAFADRNADGRPRFRNADRRERRAGPLRHPLPARRRSPALTHAAGPDPAGAAPCARTRPPHATPVRE
jgi:hypothetical protein